MPNTDKWEERFEEQFSSRVVAPESMKVEFQRARDESILSFIKSLLTEQEARVKEELIKEWLEETSEKPFNPNLSKQ